MTSDPGRPPLLIELEDRPPAAPEAVPPVPEAGPDSRAAMVRAARMAGRPPSVLGRWFWGLTAAILALVLSVAAWNWVTGLIAAVPVLGALAAGLFALLLLVMLAIALREAAAFARLSRIDGVQRAAAAAIADRDLRAAQAVAGRLSALYAGRAELAAGLARLRDRAGEQFDADALLGLAERELLGPLDGAATAEIEAAARQVATVTAVVPLALADVAAALTANLRMIRRLAEIYGGRAGVLGSWRLTRAVLAHLVATGAVAVGDDLIGSVAGGGLLSRVSRRFGEGVVNGALTARVGVAAMEVCRPLPFRALPRPSVAGLVRRALAGLFASGGGD
jgi:putative membrane protein